MPSTKSHTERDTRVIDGKQVVISEKETGWIEAFSDGVFAVAITLLVVNLSVPHAPSGTAFTAATLASKLRDQWPSYVAFVTSFATVLIMWINHHGLFKMINKADTRFLFANGFLLLLVTLVPFPTALVAEYLTNPQAAKTAMAVYAGLFVLISLAYLCLWVAASHQRRLIKPSVSDAAVRAITRRNFLGFPIYLLATIVAFVQPLISIGICVASWIFWSTTSLLDESFQKPQEA